MTAVQSRGRRLTTGLLWLAVGVLIVSTAGASLAGAGSSAPTPRASGSVDAPALARPSASLAKDPPSTLPKVIGSVAVGSDPVSGATDLANGWVYVANSISDTVSVLNGSSVVATVAFTANRTGTPVYVAYDAVNGYVYVVDRYDFESETGAVSVLNGTTVAATLAVGPAPDAAVVDPTTGLVYVTNAGGSAVSVIADEHLLAKVPVGTSPCAAAYDAASADVLVANCASDNVSALHGTSLVGTTDVGTTPDAVVYDPADSYAYVANNGSDDVSVLSDLSVVGTVPVGADPTFVAYDPSLEAVEVANTNSSSVTFLSGLAATATTEVAAGPVWLGVDPTGTFSYAAGASANEVTALRGSSAVENLSVGSYPTSGVVDPVDELVYVINAGSSNVSLLTTAFAVTFNETGLAPGTAWSVGLGTMTNGSTSSSIGFFAPPGSYPYAVSTPSGYTLVGSSPPSPLTVSNRSVLVTVTFAPVVSTTTYALTFVETGLVPTCSAHGNPGRAPAVDGGFGGYGGQGGRGGGGGSCCMGRSSSLPSWSVTVNGVTRSTNNTSVTFVEPNGLYNYTIDAPSGYRVSSSTPASPVTIAGANVTVSVTFSRCGEARELSITFQEQGLPSGTTWCVTLNATECSSGGEIEFPDLAPGTYAFNVSAVSGYSAQPSSGTVELSERSVTVTIRFSSSSHHCMG